MATPAHLFLIILSAPLAAAQNAPTRGPPSPPSYGFTGFNPSMAIIIIVLISAFFFMGFFSIYVRRCGGSGDTLSGARNGSARARSRRAANRGLDQAAIDTFPTFAYSEVKNLKLGKGTLECAVCLCEFEDEETLRLLPNCSHVFHPDCIDMWLSTHVTCPVCRSNLSAVTAADPETTGEEPAQDLEAGPESDHDREQESIVPVVGDENDHRQDRQDLVSAPTVVVTPAPNRPPRSGSSRRPKIAGRFPRSHSTGHSLVQPGDNCERYTLRLPEHVRKQILQRTGSWVACPADASEGSTRRGRIFGRSESGAAKSDRWVFSMVPSFISRSFSVKSVSVKLAGGGDVEQGAKPAFPSVNSRLGAVRGGEDEESASTRPQRSASPVFTVSTSPR